MAQRSKFGTVATIVAALIVLCVVAFWLSGAKAQGIPSRCAPYKEMTDYLKEKYNESPSAAGTSNDMGVELWIANDRSTWSFLSINISGMTCIIATGKDWTFHMFKIPGKDS